MIVENFREFETGPDPFGRKWQVKMIWLQTAISIRHSDSVDVKYWLTFADEQLERIVALMHPYLLELTANANRPLTDALCLKLAGLHLGCMVESFADMDKTISTPTLAQLEEYLAEVTAAETEAAMRT